MDEKMKEVALRAMTTPLPPLIVSRHPAAVEFIREQLPEFADAEVIESATQADVFDRVVAGNLPLRLAACCRIVYAVEFEGVPPRGQEYTIEDMRDAGAAIRKYEVHYIGEA